MAWYRTGTVTVNNNSATVTGVGTLFVDNGTLNPGDIFFAPDAKDYEIASIQSNTQFTLVTPYLGANAAGASYAIAPIGLLPSALALQVKSTLALASQASAAAILSTPAQGLTAAQQANARANIGAMAAGPIDATSIGATTPSTGAFTTLSATGASALAALTASGLITASAGLTSTAGTTNLGATNTGAIKISVTGPVYGLRLEDTAAATSVVAAPSPLISLRGSSWSTALGLVYTQSGFQVNQATYGATTLSKLSFLLASDNAALSEVGYMRSDGMLSIGSLAVSSLGVANLSLGASGNYATIASGGYGAAIYLNGATRGGVAGTAAASGAAVVATDELFAVTNAAVNSVKFSVSGLGLVTVGSGGLVSTSGTTNLGTTVTGLATISAGYTVASLPAGTLGMRAYVTDALSPSFLGTLTGGGTVKVPVMHNGTAWVAG